MIVTLTANPSLDRTVALDAPLRVGEVQAAGSVREDAGGKGINVTRVLRGSGAESIAVLPLDAHDPFGAVLQAADVPFTPVAVQGAAAGARWLVLAGSLPPGLPDDFYVDVIAAVRAAPNAPRIAVDTSGAALRAVVERGAPDLIKPNDEELADLASVTLDDGVPLPEAVAVVARGLVPARVRAAFVTLGGDGAVLVTADGAWFGTPPPTRVRSTVGAGDSSLAGFLLAESTGASPEECLRSGIRYGSAAAALPGTQAPTPADLLPGDVPVRALAP